MKYTINFHGAKLSPKAEKILERQIDILAKKLHNFAEDLPELAIVIKEHDKNHFFSGTISITLPKKKLIATVGGHEINDILHEGFEKLNKSFEAYKAKKFKGSSKYHSQSTIREKQV